MSPEIGPVRAADFKRPAVFQANLIGDQLIGLPALRALAALFPENLRLLLGEGMLSFYYRGLPVSEPVRVWSDDVESGRVDRIVQASGPCDLFLSLTNRASPFVTKLARSLGATRSVGLCKIIDEQVRVAPGKHVFERLFAVPQALEPSLRFDAFCEPPVFSPAAEAAATRYVASMRQRGQRILFVHPETKTEKTWPPDRFAWVLDRFLAARPEYVVLVSSLAPVDFGASDPRVIRIDFHLELAFALVRHVDLFLGIDSCFLHIADLFRISGVGLFGPTRPWEWGFRLSPDARHIAEASMADVRREPVLEALLDLAGALEGRSRSKPAASMPGQS
jgi:ADP-heptose:LPS heptosyltransferase